MSVKGIFFDFDGVITMEKQGTPTMLSYISKEMNIPYENNRDAYTEAKTDFVRKCTSEARRIYGERY